MEMMMATPFDDDILCLKMCVQLYIKEEYSKLYQLIQNILSSETIKNHSFRPVLVSMASVFIGLNLGKNEEGLVLARINVREDINSKNSILSQEICYSHMGYSFINLARNAIYIYDNNIYLTKAIEYLEKSNKNNYLVNLALAKCYAQKLDLDNAMMYCIESCKLNKN